MSNAVEVERCAGEVVIRFTRPEIRNPLSVSVLNELHEILKEIAVDASVKKVVFTGSGNVFASGADLREIANVNAQDARQFAERGQRLMQRIADLPQTTVAAINGCCFGGALDLALACNKRIATTDAKSAHPGAGLGIITGWGGTQRLPRLIGEANTLKLFFTAEPIDAKEALRIGLIGEITKK